MKAVLPFIAALSICGGILAQNAPQSQEPQVSPGIADYVPKASFKASIMKLTFDKSAHDISKRFNEAIASSPEWFQAYMASNAGVKPLPYHRNFGISEDEYNAMLKSFESRKLEPVQEVQVLVGRAPDGALRIDCPELGRAFAGILVDLKTGKLSTPLLVIDAPDASKSYGETADGNPFGNWKGVTWKKTETDPDKGDFKSISFIAGRSSSAGVSFISYRIKSMEANKVKSNYESILQFETPAAPSAKP